MRKEVIVAFLVFTLYIPIVSTGRPQANDVAAPITGAYKFLQADDWFQVICASGNVEVANVGGYALVKCVEK